MFRTGLSFNNPIRLYGYDLPEAMHRMQFLPFVDDFRDDYVFNNLMFAVAAWVMENLDGSQFQFYYSRSLALLVGNRLESVLRQNLGRIHATRVVGAAGHDVINLRW